MVNNKKEALHYIKQKEILDSELEKNATNFNPEIIKNIFSEYDFRFNKRVALDKDSNLRRTLTVLAEHYIMEKKIEDLLSDEDIQDIKEELESFHKIIYKYKITSDKNQKYEETEETRYFKELNRDTFFREGNRFSYYELICEANASILNSKSSKFNEVGVDDLELKIPYNLLDNEINFEPKLALLIIYYHYKSENCMDESGYVPFSSSAFVRWCGKGNIEGFVNRIKEKTSYIYFKRVRDVNKMSVAEKLRYTENDENDENIYVTIFDDGFHLAADMLQTLKKLKKEIIKPTKYFWEAFYKTKEFDILIKKIYPIVIGYRYDEDSLKKDKKDKCSNFDDFIDYLKNNKKEIEDCEKIILEWFFRATQAKVKTGNNIACGKDSSVAIQIIYYTFEAMKRNELNNRYKETNDNLIQSFVSNVSLYDDILDKITVTKRKK